MNKRVLVVDDDQCLRLMVQELLESETYEVDTAPDGLLALAQWHLHGTSYGVIVLDMMMPRMDGLQFLHQLRHPTGIWPVPIIVLSGDEDAIQQAIGMGIHSFLRKPFDLEQLLTLVAQAHC